MSKMTKAAEHARKAYPNHNQLVQRYCYRQGYHQAEKDLAMTWEDVKQIVEIADKLCPYTSKNIAEFQQEFQTEEAYYKEVLRRFNEAGGGKNL